MAQEDNGDLLKKGVSDPRPDLVGNGYYYIIDDSIGNGMNPHYAS